MIDVVAMCGLSSCYHFFSSLTHLFTSDGQLCPTGPAWTSRAVKDYVAHTDKSVVSYQTAVVDGRQLDPVQVRDVSVSECSNRGICDRSTGECICQTGFTGQVCQRMECSNDCSGRGVCMTARQVSLAYAPDSEGDGLGME